MQWESWMHKTTCLFIYANTQFIATVVICCLAVTGYTMIRQSNRFQPECQLGSFVPLFGYYTQQWRHRNKLLLPMISNKVLRKSLHTCGGFSTLASECLYWSCFCCAFLPFIFGEKITQCKMLTGPLVPWLYPSDLQLWGTAAWMCWDLETWVLLIQGDCE